jgi:hypothetical protein
MGRTKKAFTEELMLTESIRESRKRLSEAFAVPNQSNLQDIIDGKDIEILELKHQITGYKAVISYLEHQLGLGKSQ